MTFNKDVVVPRSIAIIIKAGKHLAGNKSAGEGLQPFLPLFYAAELV